MYYEVASVFGTSLTAFIFFYMSVNMGEGRWKLLQALFVFIGLFFMLMTATLVLNLAEVEAAGASITGVLNESVRVLTYVIYVTMAFYMVNLVVEALTAFMGRRKK